MKNNNDLLELYDGNSEEENSTTKASTFLSSLNIISVLMVFGFLIVIGMILFKNFTNTAIDRDNILLRQVELLNILKTSHNEQEMQHAVNEYDSLTRILEEIDNQ